MLMNLPVLPPPFSTSIYPNLEKRQKVQLRTVLKHRYGCCFWCGHEFTRNSVVTLDHVIPQGRGGSDTIDNLVVCCEHCNLTKEALLPSEWLSRLEGVMARIREVVAFPSATFDTETTLT